MTLLDKIMSMIDGVCAAPPRALSGTGPWCGAPHLVAQEPSGQLPLGGASAAASSAQLPVCSLRSARDFFFSSLLAIQTYTHALPTFPRYYDTLARFYTTLSLDARAQPRAKPRNLS